MVRNKPWYIEHLFKIMFPIVANRYQSATFWQMLGGATLVICLSSAATLQAEQNEVYFEIEENSFFFDGNAIVNGKASTLMSCSQWCAKQKICKSASFKTDGESSTCLMHKETRAKHLKMLLLQEGSFYLVKVSF